MSFTRSRILVLFHLRRWAQQNLHRLHSSIPVSTELMMNTNTCTPMKEIRKIWPNMLDKLQDKSNTSSAVFRIAKNRRVQSNTMLIAYLYHESQILNMVEMIALRVMSIRNTTQMIRYGHRSIRAMFTAIMNLSMMYHMQQMMQVYFFSSFRPSQTSLILPLSHLILGPYLKKQQIIEKKQVKKESMKIQLSTIDTEIADSCSSLLSTNRLRKKYLILNTPDMKYSKIVSQKYLIGKLKNRNQEQKDTIDGNMACGENLIIKLNTPYPRVARLIGSRRNPELERATLVKLQVSIPQSSNLRSVLCSGTSKNSANHAKISSGDTPMKSKTKPKSSPISPKSQFRKFFTFAFQ